MTYQSSSKSTSVKAGSSLAATTIAMDRMDAERLCEKLSRLYTSYKYRVVPDMNYYVEGFVPC